MKNIIMTLMLGSLLSLTTPALAGPGHGHAHGPITKEKAIHKAEHRIKRLVSKGKIDKSWKDIKASSAEQKTYKGKKEWVVTFNNPALSDKSKQILYMFFKLDGHYLATNYTGK
ncbi:MAG: DUF6488 family protein [Gammaproteobacteria bacterium]|nr:DUF6488 family protein [Gammaproteobacteria bacterium]MDH5776972.1 DUF6488 family protein [Gammaproteobacteria bacterium]